MKQSGGYTSIERDEINDWIFLKHKIGGKDKKKSVNAVDGFQFCKWILLFLLAKV